APSDPAAAPPPSAAAVFPPPSAAGTAPPPSAAASQPIAPGDTDIDSPDVRLAHEAGTHCLLGGLCFGPVLTLGVLDVFGIGALARSDHFGVGVDYQFVSFTASGIPTHLSLLTVEARVYPFAGAFFLSGGLAWQHANFRGHVTYQGDSQIPPIDTVVSGRVNVPVLKLGIGFMGRSGFIIGTDLALGIQLGRTKIGFDSDLPQIPQVVAVENKVRKRADAFVSGLPFLAQLNLIRLGFIF
ncbi:MAG TPA: hypothetical protein VHZ95_01385, partial [Polyangiales bacterium]|nr:hypothetical protein [Polyangiales bacterium]